MASSYDEAKSSQLLKNGKLLLLLLLVVARRRWLGNRFCGMVITVPSHGPLGKGGDSGRST